jgi:LPXTG-motif cell wall-anchored protein
LYWFISHKVKSPNCKDGHIVQGGLSIETREVDNLNNTIEAILYDMEEKMRDDKLLGKDIPHVTSVTYLGRSQEEVENPSQVPGVSGIVNTSNKEKENDDDNTLLVAGLCTAALLLLLLLLLLIYRKKKNDENRNNERFLAIVDNPDDFNSLPGTGDPPGSFHHGVYHYMRDGQNYLSTNCFDCHETKTLSNSDYGNVLPPPMTSSNVNEDPYYSNVIIPPSKRFSSDTTGGGSNVHKCTSSTCQICLPERKTTIMIKVNDGNSKRSQSSSEMDYNMGVAHSTYEL